MTVPHVDIFLLSTKWRESSEDKRIWDQWGSGTVSVDQGACPMGQGEASTNNKR